MHNKVLVPQLWWKFINWQKKRPQPKFRRFKHSNTISVKFKWHVEWLWQESSILKLILIQVSIIHIFNVFFSLLSSLETMFEATNKLRICGKFKLCVCNWNVQHKEIIRKSDWQESTMRNLEKIPESHVAFRPQSPVCEESKCRVHGPELVDFSVGLVNSVLTGKWNCLANLNLEEL